MFNNTARLAFIFRDRSNFLLLYNIEKYINGAILQAQRVDGERKDHFKKFMGLPLAFFRRQEKIFLDAHFYFVCVSQIEKNLKRLKDQLRNGKLNKVYLEFRTDFNSEIRNDLEHIDARAVGKTKLEKNVDEKTKRLWMRDFVNFQGDKLSFGGRKYAINKDSVKKLKNVHEDIMEIIREDYALKDASFKEIEDLLKMTKSLKRQFSGINEKKLGTTIMTKRV